MELDKGVSYLIEFKEDCVSVFSDKDTGAVEAKVGEAWLPSDCAINGGGKFLKLKPECELEIWQEDDYSDLCIDYPGAYEYPAVLELLEISVITNADTGVVIWPT